MESRPSRVALPLAAAILGVLAVIAAAQPRTAPSRNSQRLEIVDLIEQQDERVRDLRGEVRDLEERIAAVGRGADARSGKAEGLLEEARELDVMAGGAALEGPGVTVVLDDSSASRSPTGDPNDLVVHERDIQTVVNALWAAGAEAVSLNGERLSTTSAVRCAGNTLLLHGALHTPPYEIRAIGDAQALADTLSSRPGMGRLLENVHAFGLGFSVEPAQRVVLPATATPGLARAVPVR